jgi:hypothetical protein
LVISSFIVEEAVAGFSLSSRSIDSTLRLLDGELVAGQGRHAVDGAAAGQWIENADADRFLGKRRSGTQDADGRQHCAAFHVIPPG